MSYVEEQRVSSFIPVTGGSTEIDALSGAGVHTASYVCMEQVLVRSLYAVVTTLVASDTAEAVITIKRRPTYGSATGEVSIGTLTIPDTTAAGKVIYKNVSPVEIQPGDQVVFEITTAATDGSSVAGNVVYGLRISANEEEEANSSDMVLSA